MLTLLLLVLGAAPAQMPPNFPQKGHRAPAYEFADVILPKGSAPLTAAALTHERLKGKVVVLDFYATWCAPCVAAMPHTNSLIETTRELPVVYLAVANEDKAVLMKFFETHPFSTIVALDKDDATSKNYFVKSLPFVVIIDTEGNVSQFTHPSMISKEMILAAIRSK